MRQPSMSIVRQGLATLDLLDHFGGGDAQARRHGEASAFATLAFKAI